jgi:hypothetical protein
MIRNPYVLAGLAVAGAIVLAIIFVILTSSSGGGGNFDDITGGGNNGTPGALRGIVTRSIATSTVREGPSTEYTEIGTLRSGQDVEVVGRNNETTWFLIYFPPRSQLKGWVPASALRVPDNAGTLAVVSATPISRPTEEPPTPPPEPTATATPEGTATPQGGAVDIAVEIGSCVRNQQLSLIVRNVGGAPINNRVVVVTTPGGSETRTLSLPTGAAATIPTNTVVQGNAPITASVTFREAPGDTNPANNAATCTPSGANPTPQSGGTNVPPPIDDD